MYHLFFYNNPRKQSKSINRIVLLSTILSVLFIITMIVLANAQNNALILNGGYIRMSGGSSGTPLYLVVNHNNVAAITRTSGSIISDGEYNRVKWNMRTATGNFEFPFGYGSAYTPFVFNKTTAGTESGTGAVSVSSYYTLNNTTWPNPTSLCGVAATEDDVVDRFWIIDALNYSANPVATVRLYYNDPLDIAGIPAEAGLQAQRWNSALPITCKWELPPAGTVDVTDNFVEIAGISDFSPWALVNKLNPLPIELLYFKARWKDHQYTAVLLEWKTATEINNDYFEIQRSADAVNFTTIKTLPGAGNSTQVIYYTVSDNEPEKEATSYYRLKQVDYDGKYTFSNIEAINALSGIDLITIYPNPASEYIDYLVYSTKNAVVSVWAIDAAGKVVIFEKKELKKGVNKLRLDTSFLSSGGYVLQVTAGKNTKTEKQFVIK